MKKGYKTKWDDPLFKIILIAIGFLLGMAFVVIHTRIVYKMWLL